MMSVDLPKLHLAKFPIRNSEEFEVGNGKKTPIFSAVSKKLVRMVIPQEFLA